MPDVKKKLHKTAQGFIFYRVTSGRTIFSCNVLTNLCGKLLTVDISVFAQVTLSHVVSGENQHPSQKARFQ